TSGNRSAGTFRCAARSPCSRPEGSHKRQEGRVRRSRPMQPVGRAVQPPPGFDCPLGTRQLWSVASRRFAQSPVSALPLFRHRSFCTWGELTTKRAPTEAEAHYFSCTRFYFVGAMQVTPLRVKPKQGPICEAPGEAPRTQPHFSFLL